MKSETIIDRDYELPRASQETEEVHLLDIVILLARRRRRILMFTLAAAILGALASFLLPRRYTAETTLLPPNSNSAISSALLSQVGGSGALASAAGASLGIKNPGDMYISLLKSRTVQEGVVQRLGLQERYRLKVLSDARWTLDSRVDIQLGLKDGLITISASDRDPNEAALIANGYVDEFRKFSANLAITEASQRRVFFQQQLLDAKEKLAAAEEALKTTQQSTGVVQIDSQTRALVESAAALRAQVSAKEVQLQGMRAYATDDNPEVIETRRQLEELQAQLTKVSGSDSPSSMLSLKGRLPEAGLEYLRRLRDVKFYDTVSELIARQFEMAKLDEARQGAVMQVVDLAVPPERPSFPRVNLIMAVAIVFGFAAGCLWCILAEGMRRFRSHPEEHRRIQALRASFH